MQPLQPDIGILATSLEDERRQFQRWEPEETTTVCVSSSKGNWCGRVLNLSEGGSEVLGLPPKIISLGALVMLEITFRGCVVTREGSLQSIRALAVRDSHVLAFGSFWQDRESQFACPCCGAVIMYLASMGFSDGEVILCSDCDERANEQLGRDYEYDELGWGG